MNTQKQDVLKKRHEARKDRQLERKQARMNMGSKVAEAETTVKLLTREVEAGTHLLAKAERQLTGTKMRSEAAPGDEVLKKEFEDAKIGAGEIERELDVSKNKLSDAVAVLAGLQKKLAELAPAPNPLPKEGGRRGRLNRKRARRQSLKVPSLFDGTGA